MIAAPGGCDTIVFTGGIGGNDAAARRAIPEGLSRAGPFPVHIVPAREEHRIARNAASLLHGFRAGPG